MNRTDYAKMMPKMFLPKTKWSLPIIWIVKIKFK